MTSNIVNRWVAGQYFHDGWQLTEKDMGYEGCELDGVNLMQEIVVDTEETFISEARGKKA
jgi:hypothetical protein